MNRNSPRTIRAINPASMSATSYSATSAVAPLISSTCTRVPASMTSSSS
jgi:hypothetical protein